jgi:hypothetical protein
VAKTTKKADKQDNSNDRITVRFGELMRLIPELIQENGATDVSEYIRGLVFEDARGRKKKMDGVPTPGHITARILRELEQGKKPSH